MFHVKHKARFTLVALRHRCFTWNKSDFLKFSTCLNIFDTSDWFRSINSTELRWYYSGIWRNECFLNEFVLFKVIFDTFLNNFSTNERCVPFRHFNSYMCCNFRCYDDCFIELWLWLLFCAVVLVVLGCFLLQ